MSARSRMYLEAAQAPAVVRAQLDHNASIMRELGGLLREMSPRAVLTCARGSSDNAATFGRYLIETRAGVLTSSAAPSLSSVYEAAPDLRGVVFIVISQSGRSPDLLVAAENAKRCGARVIALCNSMDSPLVERAHHAIDLRAGAETSVAATKSYVASLTALVHLLAQWTADESLIGALARVPDQLEQAWSLDWSSAVTALRPAVNLFVVGRGHGLGIAQEAALKLKETCGLHAEAFSAAEVKHGPMVLVERGFPVLMFSQDDESRAGIQALASDFVARRAPVLIAGTPVDGATVLPTFAAHPVIEPILFIQSFYRVAALLAGARGLDPDAPPHLKKVTETT